MHHKDVFMNNSQIQRTIQSLEGAYAPSTIRGYTSDIKSFTNFCASENAKSFPADPQTVVDYLSDQTARGFNPRTLERRLYAIRKFHRLKDLPDPTRDNRVHLSFRRIKRASHARPSQAAALTSRDIDKLLHKGPQCPRTLRNHLIIALGYDLLARRSELVALTDGDCQPAEGGTYSFLIRRSKSDPFGSGRLAFCSPRTARLLEEWWAWRGDKTPWLFCPIYKDQPVDRALSCTTVRRTVQSLMLSLGKSEAEARRYSGHSMRVGAAQDLLRRGHDTAGIMRAGGWKSLKVLSRYLESAESNPWL